MFSNSKRANNWYDYTTKMMCAFDIGKLPRWQRRLAIIAFPVTLPAWLAWFMFWAVAGIYGLILIDIIEVWSKED